MLWLKKRSKSFLALSILCILMISQPFPSFSQEQDNQKATFLIVTDLLDDDGRGLAHLLGLKKLGQLPFDISAIYVTRGEAAIKTEAARTMVEALRLGINVIQGPGSDFSDNEVTEFAVRSDLSYGRAFLTKSQQRLIHSRKSDRTERYNQLSAVVEEAKNNGKKLDTILLSSPSGIDFVTLQKEFPGVIRDFYGMGLYKELEGEISTAFNTMADFEEVSKFIRDFKAGRFGRRMIHVPSKVLAERIPGITHGYYTANSYYWEMLTHAMRRSPLLDRVRNAAIHYAASWHAYSMSKFGGGQGSHDRWIPDTIVHDPRLAARFYIADVIPITAAIAFSDSNEISKLSPAYDQSIFSLLAKRVSLSDEINPNKLPKDSFPFGTASTQESMKGERWIDLDRITLADFGEDIVREMARVSGLIANLGITELGEGFQKLLIDLGKESRAEPEYKTNNFQDFAAKLRARMIEEDPTSAAELNFNPNKSLIFTFKNAPDDWMALALLTQDSLARAALEKGGVIVEGFEAPEVALNVKAFLKYHGLKNVRVASGLNYHVPDMKKFANFAGEIEFYTQKANPSDETTLGISGFRSAAKEAGIQVSPSELVTPEKIFAKTISWLSKDQSRKADFLILGEGVDTLKEVLEQRKIRFDQISLVSVMGGGRVVEKSSENDGATWVLSRNWLRTNYSMEGYQNLAQNHGVNVDIYGSHQYSKFFPVAKSMDTDNIGETASIIQAFRSNANSNPFSRAIVDHTNRWSQVFQWMLGVGSWKESGGQKGGAAFWYDSNQANVSGNFLALFQTARYLEHLHGISGTPRFPHSYDDFGFMGEVAERTNDRNQVEKFVEMKKDPKREGLRLVKMRMPSDTDEVEEVSERMAAAIEKAQIPQEQESKSSVLWGLCQRFFNWRR